MAWCGSYLEGDGTIPPIRNWQLLFYEGFMIDNKVRSALICQMVERLKTLINHIGSAFRWHCKGLLPCEVLETTQQLIQKLVDDIALETLPKWHVFVPKSTRLKPFHQQPENSL